MSARDLIVRHLGVHIRLSSDGLQPDRDGLQPTSDGLQPESDGLLLSTNQYGMAFFTKRQITSASQARA